MIGYRGKISITSVVKRTYVTDIDKLLVDDDDGLELDPHVHLVTSRD